MLGTPSTLIIGRGGAIGAAQQLLREVEQMVRSELDTAVAAPSTSLFAFVTRTGDSITLLHHS